MFSLVYEAMSKKQGMFNGTTLYLLGVGEVNFFRDSGEPSKQHGDLPPAFTAFLEQCVQLRSIITRELIVVVNDVVSRLSTQSLLMYGLELLAWRCRCISARSG